MTPENSPAFLFDDVRVEPASFRAFKAGNLIQLEPKALRLLLYLIENRGRLIEKEEILNTIWSGTHVTENALAGEIAKLRKTLGDDPKAARYIQTVHTRGYRFIAEVSLGNGELSYSGGVAAGNVAKVFENGKPQPTAANSLPITGIAGGHSRRILSTHSAWIALALIGVLGLSILMGVKLWKRGHKTAVASSTPATTLVAVLPFKSSGPSEGDEYLGAEISDALTARLATYKRLSVRPMTTVLHYANSNQDPTAIGSLLKVDYVLLGEIDKSKQHVTAHLIRVRDGAQLLAENYDEKFNDIFQLEDSLCARVLSNLLVTLDHEETQRLRKHYTENQQAYDAFLKAHFFMAKATKEDLNRSIDYFRQAIDLDPEYAMAYAGLSDVYMKLGRYGRAPAEFVPQSRAAVMKALELDETVAYAHSMLGRIAYQYDWDFARAEREYARARELEPTLVHGWYAAYLMTLNHVAEAGVEFKKFEEFLPFLAADLGMAQYFYLTRQYDSAVDVLNGKLKANPTLPQTHEALGRVFEQQRRSQQAIEEFQKAIELSGGNYGTGALGHIYAALGRKTEARNAIGKLDELSRRAYVSPYEKAVIYAGLGDKDETLKYLQKAFDERSLAGPMLRFDPRLNDLRTDARFQDFMRRVGVTP